MLRSLVHEFQEMRVRILSCAILLLIGCSQPNDDATTQPQGGEKGAATESSEPDSGPQLDAPLEEPPLPTESNPAASKPDDAS